MSMATVLSKIVDSEIFVLNLRSQNFTEWFLSLKVKHEKRTVERVSFFRGIRWRN